MAHIISKERDAVLETTDSHAAFLVKNRPDRFCLAEEVEEPSKEAADKEEAKTKETPKSVEVKKTDEKPEEQKTAPKAKRTRKPRTKKANPEG